MNVFDGEEHQVLAAQRNAGAPDEIEIASDIENKSQVDAVGEATRARDIDEVAVDVARANAAANNLADRLICVEAAGFDHPELSSRAPFDLVFANILKGPLVALAPDMAEALATAPVHTYGSDDGAPAGYLPAAAAAAVPTPNSPAPPTRNTSRRLMPLQTR